MDRQEAELNAEQRRLQIERANKILFDESDRVKNFHSTLMKADTMAENEVLMGYKKQIAVLKKAQEAAFVEQQRQALEVRGRPHGGMHGRSSSVRYATDAGAAWGWPVGLAGAACYQAGGTRQLQLVEMMH